MKELVVCKSCGFIMEKGKLKDKCPACGVPAKMFEPYTEKISARRKFILSLDIHPVIVHLPQAFSFTVPVLAFLALIISGGEIEDYVLSALTVICFIQPFTVIFAFLAGLLDGKIRFRRVTTPILIKKMLLAGLFFLTACGNFIIIFTLGFSSPEAQVIAGILGLAGLGCASVLGLLGKSLLNAKFPG